MALFLWKLWTIYIYDAKKAFEELVVFGTDLWQSMGMGPFYFNTLSALIAEVY